MGAVKDKPETINPKVSRLGAVRLISVCTTIIVRVRKQLMKVKINGSHNKKNPWHIAPSSGPCYKSLRPGILDAPYLWPFVPKARGTEPRSWTMKTDIGSTERHCNCDRVPSGKRLHNYGKSPCYQWVNQLFQWRCWIFFCLFTIGYPNKVSQVGLRSFSWLLTCRTVWWWEYTLW